MEEDEDLEEDEYESKANYLFMELQSTVSFKEIDIDAMIEHTSLDDFVRGLYIKAIQQPETSLHKETPHDKMMKQLLETKDPFNQAADKAAT